MPYKPHFANKCDLTARKGAAVVKSCILLSSGHTLPSSKHLHKDPAEKEEPFLRQASQRTMWSIKGPGKEAGHGPTKGSSHRTLWSPQGLAVEQVSNRTSCGPQVHFLKHFRQLCILFSLAMPLVGFRSVGKGQAGAERSTVTPPTFPARNKAGLGHKWLPFIQQEAPAPN